MNKVKKRQMSQLVKPREPRQAYFIFEEKYRPLVKQELSPDGGDVNVQELNVALRKKWSEIRKDSTENAKLMQLVEEEKAQYVRAMEEYKLATEGGSEAEDPPAGPVADVQNQMEQPVEKKPKSKISFEDLGLSQQDATCPICQEIFFQPITLPCSHKVCLECAENMLNRSYEENQREGYRRKKSGYLQCGICRREHQVNLEECPVDKMLESILRTVMGGEYNTRMLAIQEKQNKSMLIEKYLPNNGYGVMGDIGQIVHGMVSQLIEGYIAEVQGKQLVINPGEIIQILQTSDFITAAAGFSIGNLAYFHFYHYMVNGAGGQWRMYRIAGKTIMLNTSTLMDYVTADERRIELDPRQKEIVYLACMFSMVYDNSRRRMDRMDNSTPDIIVPVEAKLSRLLGPEFETFSYDLFRKCENTGDGGRALLSEYFDEIYPQIISNPKDYPGFAESIGIKV